MMGLYFFFFYVVYAFEERKPQKLHNPEYLLLPFDSSLHAQNRKKEKKKLPALPTVSIVSVIICTIIHLFFLPFLTCFPSSLRCYGWSMSYTIAKPFPNPSPLSPFTSVTYPSSLCHYRL
jgi:hypothetical protein